VNPVLLARAMAPPLAAEHEGRARSPEELAAHCRAAARTPHDLLLAEGAGGGLVPLNAQETMADVAAALGWPVVLVVGMRLGCLNHALLTAAAIRAAGLALAGWVANDAWPAMDAAPANVATLEARLGAPRLGTVPWLGDSADGARAGACLDPSPLLEK
jgi:dethiobiotin synthetase